MPSLHLDSKQHIGGASEDGIADIDDKTGNGAGDPNGTGAAW